jgi:hypothetical protein
MQHKRHRFPWAMNEINRLHNEYEIKQLTIQQIAQLHERSVYAILNKLQDEEIIDKSWKGVRGWSWPDNSNTNVNAKSTPTLDLQPSVFFDQHRVNEDSDSDYEPSDDENDDDYEPYNKHTIFNQVRSVMTRMSQLATTTTPKKNTKVSRNNYI